MGVGSWFKNLFGSKARPEQPFAVGRWSTAPVRRGSAELLAAYKTMPWLNTLVDVVADGVADLQWKVYRPVGGSAARAKLASVMRMGLAAPGSSLPGRREHLKAMLEAGEAVEVQIHPMLQLIANPSDQLTGRQVAKLMQIHLDLIGEAFPMLDFIGKMPVGFWPVPPSAVTALPDYTLPPDQRVFKVNFGRIAGEVPAGRMLHLRHPDPADPMGRGIGKGFTLADELDTDEYAALFAKNYFYNHGTPAAVIALEGAPNSETPAMKRFKESFAADHHGVDNAGKVLITSGKVSATRLDTDLQKMDLGPIRKGLHDFARMNWRVPPETVGDLDSSNKSTAHAAHDALARNAIVPRAEFWRSEYQHRFMPMFASEGDCLDYESPIPADREHQLRVMSAFPAEFTGNEARGLAGMKARPGHDEPMKPHPGQTEAEPKPADAPQGSEADTIEEQSQPSNKKSDPPWASQPIA